MSTPNAKTATLGPALKPKVSGEDWIMRVVLVGIALYLLITMVFPLYAILSKSFQTDKGVFIGLDNYIKFFSTPALFWSIKNSLFVTIMTCVIVVPLAFIFAYALTRSCMPLKGLFKGIALIPILMPSLSLDITTIRRLAFPYYLYRKVLRKQNAISSFILRYLL